MNEAGVRHILEYFGVEITPKVWWASVAIWFDGLKIGVLCGCLFGCICMLLYYRAYLGYTLRDAPRRKKKSP